MLIIAMIGNTDKLEKEKIIIHNPTAANILECFLLYTYF